MSVKFHHLFILLGLFLMACSPTAPAVDTPIELGDSSEELVSEGALEPVVESDVADDSETNTAVLEEAQETETENNAATSGLVEEVTEETAIVTEGEIAVSEPLPADRAQGGGLATDSMMIEPVDPLTDTELILAVDLPTDPTSASTWSQPAFYGDLASAQTWANRFRFPGPLYQEYLDPSIRDEYQSLGEGVWRAPFYAFNGNERLTISAGGVFYENRNFVDDYPTTITFEQTRPLAEAQIADWGGLGFDFVLLEDGPGNVVVKRLINGRLVDFAEAYLHYNNSGQLIYASYNLLEQLQAQPETPIKTAADAWAQLQTGVIDYDQITYYLDYGYGPIPTEPDFYPEYLTWFRTHDAGETATVYGYPFMLLPVQDDSLPYVQVGDFIVSGAPEELFAMASENGGQLRIQGQIDESGKNISLISWEAMGDNNFGIPLDGMLTREGENGRLDASDGNTYFIPQLPSDFPESLDAYVYGFAVEQGEAPYPVIDWLNIDQKVEDGGLAADGPTTLPVELGFEQQPINTITFDSIELGYTYLVTWDEEITEQPDYDVPPTNLAPVWLFVGTTDTGQQITFSVRATTE